MFGTLTSPPNDGMCQSEQAIICAPSSAELVDHTAGDLGLDLL
ncbi:hypothetical protein RchiOBHm_Chr5g0052241 [Rosa chinensis]|uniref:Uncharacterized protein n=1 Tax=Rosa chinensis TaxID=74649 RepID=A0A2P6QFK1_ROSCH|nr:hypothetical protein RchiOBHm_Chr5g0052241 [Rosa chinensis]